MLDAEQKHPELKGHGERTASFAVAAAHAMGVLEPRLISLRIAAALHFSICNCCENDQRVLLRMVLPDAPPAADFIRGMHAEWRMVTVESSILRAACRHDLRHIGIECPREEYRPGVIEALNEVAQLITPIDYVS